MADYERGSPGPENVGEQAEKNIRTQGQSESQSQATRSASRGQGTQVLECCGTTFNSRDQYNEHRRSVHGGEGVTSGRRESSL